MSRLENLWYATSATYENVTTYVNNTGRIIEETESLGILTLPILLAYFFISLLGVAGNVMVVMCVTFLPRLRNVQNIYVTNLCIADILLGMNGSLIIIDIYDQNWALENGLCNVVSFMTFIPPIAVIGSTVCIAKNRYDAIVNASHQYTYVNCRKTAVLMSIVVWCVSVILGSPIVIGWVSSRAGLFCACCIYFRDNQEYSIFLTVVVYFIPNVIIVCCYISIFCFVRQSRNRINEHSQKVKQNRNTIGTDIKLAVRFIILFMMFNCCFLPATVVFWMTTMENSVNNQTARNAATMLFAVNIIANPIGYFCMNSTARREVKKFIFCTDKGILKSKSLSETPEDDGQERKGSTDEPSSGEPVRSEKKSSAQSESDRNHNSERFNDIKVRGLVGEPSGEDCAHTSGGTEGHFSQEINHNTHLETDQLEDGENDSSSDIQGAVLAESYARIRRSESLDVNIVTGEG